MDLTFIFLIVNTILFLVLTGISVYVMILMIKCMKKYLRED